MKIIAKINFGINGVYYVKGEEIKDFTYEQIAKLNELGYIEPLDYKDLIFLKRELTYKNKKEE